jgi:NhaP-type Na+/H+ or K+/H+ antiporter
MLMCSLLCSSDVIAAISLISYDKQPKLFSIVFGEGIMNDAVSIILFNTVHKYTSSNSVVDVHTPGKIIFSFIGLAINSLFIGTLFGLLSAYVLKTFREFSKSAVYEAMMIFCIGYLSYVTSEMAQYSGIISLLTAGVVMAHYTWYNLSPQGKQSSFIVFQFLGYLIEAFVFSYLGLTFFSYFDEVWSLDLILVELVIIVVGRGLGTVGLVAVLRCFGYATNTSMKELLFIWYAGMIRGAIAFGLVLRIDKSSPNRSVIVTTSLALVIFTTVVFGSTLRMVSKYLFDDQEEANAFTPAPTLKDVDLDESLASVDLSDEDESHYSRVLHPNEIKTTRKIHTGCGKYFNRFDELIMKPIFIYKYEKNMQKSSKEFFEFYMKQGQEIERDL